MLFHEIYGSYFSAVSKVLEEICAGDISDKRFYEIIRQNSFEESVLSISALLKGGDWNLLTNELNTPITNKPFMPLTVLQKRWLKALLSDPRIKLFSVSDEGLLDTEPLYAPDTFVYFDRYTDGDPYEDEMYISNFRTVLGAIKCKQVIEVVFVNKNGQPQSSVCFPCNIEYSSKDDKFRLVATSKYNTYTFNMARISFVDILGDMEGEAPAPAVSKRSIVMTLTDERNALERALMHFSHLHKETVRLDDVHYKITLHYDKDDETEILIRVLSFGPMLKVISPESFIDKIKDRLILQKSCGLF